LCFAFYGIAEEGAQGRREKFLSLIFWESRGRKETQSPHFVQEGSRRLKKRKDRGCRLWRGGEGGKKGSRPAQYWFGTAEGWGNKERKARSQSSSHAGKTSRKDPPLASVSWWTGVNRRDFVRGKKGSTQFANAGQMRRKKSQLRQRLTER